MATVDKITHIFEPTPLQCGQAVISMLTGKSVEEVINYCGKTNETNLNDMKNTLFHFGITVLGDRKEFECIAELPEIALLSLETPHCWHWSLFFRGTFFDPEYGEIKHIPPSNRKYYWELQ